MSGSFNGSQKKTKDQDDSESKKYENRIESIRFTGFIFFTFLYGIPGVPSFKRGGKLFRFQDLSGSGKLVGVISHREELIENIPQQIRVTKERDGSRIKIENGL